jgi:hypothetical protein
MRRFFRNQQIRNKNCLCRPCLFTDQDEMRTSHRCFLPNFGSIGQAVLEKIIFNWPIRKKNCLWWPYLLTDRDKMSNLYREPSIDVNYQVSVQAVSEEKIIMWKDNGRQTTDAKWWQKITLPLAKKHNTTCSKLWRWATCMDAIKITGALMKDKQLLFLIRPVKFLPVKKERQILLIRKKIHCHLRNGYFITVNQLV